jgi:F-type H+-transporting ATPase subunit b
MELVSPGLGLIFWTALAFGTVLLILRKYAWRPILAAIKERENYISASIRHSKKIERELADLDKTREKMLMEARNSAEVIIKQAKKEGADIIEKAQIQARKDANQIIEAARNAISAERKAAEKEIREQIVLFSLEMAQKLIKEEFKDVDKKNKYISNLMADIKLN